MVTPESPISVHMYLSQNLLSDKCCDLASSEGITADTAPSVNPSTDSLYASKWFAQWLAHFRQVSTDVSWQALVAEWTQYEALNSPDGVSFLHFCLSFCLIFHYRGCLLHHIQRKFSGGSSTKELSASFHKSRNHQNLEQYGCCGG